MDDPTPDKPASGQPLWQTLITPLAVLVGCAAIVAAIFATDSGGGDEIDTDALVAAISAAGGGDGISGAPSDGGFSEPQTVQTTFESYAAELDLDLDAFDQCLQTPGIADTINEQLNRGAALGVSGTPTFFVNNKRIVGSQPLAIFEEVIAAELSDNPPTSIEEYSTEVQALAGVSPARFEILAEKPDATGAYVEGDEDAKVTLLEYSDFQCPFCQRWTLTALPAIRDNDDVAVAFLHFPLVQIHPNAGRAHVAAECAGEQGGFWAMHDLLFARQTAWADLPAQ